MSEFQSKKRSTSADPRLVIDCTFFNPGTLLTASSMGRVIVTSIWSMGITPLSMPTTILGKSVLGNTETGMVNAKYPPTSARLAIKKRIGRENRRNQGASACRAALSPRGEDFRGSIAATPYTCHLVLPLSHSFSRLSCHLSG